MGQATPRQGSCEKGHTKSPSSTSAARIQFLYFFATTYFLSPGNRWPGMRLLCLGVVGVAVGCLGEKQNQNHPRRKEPPKTKTATSACPFDISILLLLFAFCFCLFPKTWVYRETGDWESPQGGLSRYLPPVPRERPGDSPVFSRFLPQPKIHLLQAELPTLPAGKSRNPSSPVPVYSRGWFGFGKLPPPSRVVLVFAPAPAPPPPASSDP